MPDQYLHTVLGDLADMYGADVVLKTAHEMWDHRVAVPSSPSRTSDPATSHASGERKRTRDVRRFSPGSISGRLLDHFWHAPATAQYAAEACTVVPFAQGLVRAMRVESARKRVSDLQRAGYIEDSGVRRKNDGSPDESIVWSITTAGIHAHVLMERTGWSTAAAA